ncbi:BlaI/MecI/CopY family transcriptional regulator [Candidatus Latescibacterota bacterium]
MPRKQSRSFTDVELEFMHILWNNDEISPEEIRAILENNGRVIASGSIRNVLAIMSRKGYVTRRKEGKAFLYTAKVNKENAQKSMLSDLLENAFDRSESLLVAALLDRKEIDDNEQEEIFRLLEKHRGGNKQ